MSLAQDALSQEFVERVTLQGVAQANVELSRTSTIENNSEKLTELFGDMSGTRIRRVVVRANGNDTLEFERSITVEGGPKPSRTNAEFWYNRSSSSEQFGTDLVELAYKHCSLPQQVATDPAVETILTQQLQGMNEVSRQILERVAKGQADQDEAFKKKVAKLEADHTALLGRLEKEYDQKSEALNRREDELLNQESKHERRQLRASITENIKERLSSRQVRNRNNNSRIIVTSFALLGMLIAATSAFYGYFEAIIPISADSESTPPQSYLGQIDWIQAVRVLASSTLFAILLFYILGYWRKSIDEDIQFDRMLERYALDIDRASWVVETVLEVRGENRQSEAGDGEDVPDLWLQGVTANLFPFDSKIESDDDTALDALGELLKKSANLSIGPNGAQLDISGGSARAIGRTKSGQ